MEFTRSLHGNMTVMNPDELIEINRMFKSGLRGVAQGLTAPGTMDAAPDVAAVGNAWLAATKKPEVGQARPPSAKKGQRHWGLKTLLFWGNFQLL
jgi:hypothetical protein